MISLSKLNKLIKFTFFFLILFFKITFTFAADDIWKKKEDKKVENGELNNQQETTIDTQILSDQNNLQRNIDEQKINQSDQTIIGLFDPEKNNFNINMWAESDGKDIKNIFKRINKLKLSKFSENLLFQVLFTNAYPPNSNLTSNEFLKIKIDWLIKNQRFKDLETLLLTNSDVGQETKALKFLINENLSEGDIKSACEKIRVIGKNVKNNYLSKFKIYCLINDDRKNEAQLIFDLLVEEGFDDKFFEDKINFLLGIKDQTSQKILDNNLLNFYLSHITSSNFDYEPNEKTDEYIWRYLSSSNLIKVDSFEDEKIISTYELAAVESSFRKDEIFKIYLKLSFNFNQLINATEIYKNLPNYKARALIYQSILLSDNVKKKIYLAFLLKDLFAKDKLSSVYSEELSNILVSIDPNQIPDDYNELVKENLRNDSQDTKKIKFNNDILHRSKIIKHFLDNSEKINRTNKDFKTVYKKIKKNKKYFISIMDIIVLESLATDGISLPDNLDYGKLYSQLTVPKNLDDLVKDNQLGLVMLKIIEIIGEDNINDLDPETIYFLNKILNELNLKKIRNNILSEVLPIKI